MQLEIGEDSLFLNYFIYFWLIINTLIKYNNYILIAFRHLNGSTYPIQWDLLIICILLQLTLSCVCALIEKASALVNTPEPTSNERQWSKFLKTLARALKHTTLTVSKPILPLSENRLIQHLKQLDSRTTIEILQRGKPAIDFSDITKMDVSEQLVKHLCWYLLRYWLRLANMCEWVGCCLTNVFVTGQ